MQIEITQESILESVKPFTRATTTDWGNVFKRTAQLLAIAYAFVYAAGTYLGYVFHNPAKALASYMQTNQPLPVEELVVEPEPPVVKAEANRLPVTKTRATRSRKRSAKGAARTTPAVSVA